MAVASFTIETYSVGSYHAGGSSWRAVGLTGTPEFHGIRGHATVYFTEPKVQNVGFVTNVDQPNFNGLTVSGYAWRGDFSDFLDLLRNEAPLYFYYSFEGSGLDPSKPIRTLYSFQLGTASWEPPGEGPEDESP